MTLLSLLPIFMIGLLGSVHCIGMCGGIVGAFSSVVTPPTRFPVAVVAAGYGTVARMNVIESGLRVLSYNAGRIGSYAIAGALAGGLANGARAMSGLSMLQLGGYWLANLMLVALGLYLMNVWRGLAQLEVVGRTVWNKVQPLTKLLLPVDSPLKMLALGGLWGWLPCGMVYGVLLTAMLTGSALSGASVMLAFGLGTLPTLLAMGLFGVQLRGWMRQREVRVICGSIVLGFGLLGLLRAAHGLPMSWLDAVCITPFAGAGGS